MKKEKILSLLDEIKAADSSPDSVKLPRGTVYLDYDRVLCRPGGRGDSRFPYERDGLVVWVHSDGYIDACESVFSIFRNCNFGEESPVSFFGGLMREDGTYFPVSVTGASRQLFEEGVDRCTVYSLKHAVSVADTPDVVFTLRTHVDGKKHIHFSLSAVNKSDREQKIYLASFMEALLRFNESETFWQRMSKYGRIEGDGCYVLESRNGDSDMLVINRRITEGAADFTSYTTARGDFLGAKGLSISASESLKSGRIERASDRTSTTDLPCCAEIHLMTLKAGQCANIEYELTVCHRKGSETAYIGSFTDPDAVEKELEAAEKAEAGDFDNIKIRFADWKDGKLRAAAMNRFLRSVQKQTSFCAHGKNYAGAYLGIRDVFQQLEGALIWQPEISREKIVYALNNILTTGRPPRMFSVPSDPTDPEVTIPVCLEKYIDQGVWIISTIYTYLSYTGDWSILDEKCNYIDAPDEAWCDAHKTGEVTSVLEHLIRIMGYLESNIDHEYGTECMKVLFGDWNDAVDGLGRTDDPNREFGSGVTVMATLQFYRNCHEMIEILSHVGGYGELCDRYAKEAANIEKGLDKYAIDTDAEGHRRIVHGWGDKLSYKVGSYCDPDGKSRFSLTPNAIWANTGFIRRDPTLKESLMECFDAVSSKYGLKTFDKPFPPDCKGVGRIVNILPGTYENCCAYAHGSLFGALAMFEIGESRRAWEEIEKTVVITHDNCTMTTFVMPNSYCENAEFNMDGESLGDWHTGSGTVLVKGMIRCGFGIAPDLSGLRIQFPAYFPARSGEITVPVRDAVVHIEYEDTGAGKRTITVDGADYTEQFDSLMNIPVLFIESDKLHGNINIKITD